MRCSNFILSPGETLYLPKGMIHFARALAADSVHVTIGLQRVGELKIEQGSRRAHLSASFGLSFLGLKSYKNRIH